MYKVGITGGIGSGKSTLSRELEGLGTPIYYSDSEAKRLMVESVELRSAIIAAFGAESYDGAELNRPYLASKVFNSPSELERLNGIVHPAVRAHFEQWAAVQSADYVVMESAILFDAGLDKQMDATVAVLAPEPLRVERIKLRDNLSEGEILARIAAQLTDDQIADRATFCVVNIIQEEIADSAERLDKLIRREASKR